MYNMQKSAERLLKNAASEKHAEASFWQTLNMRALILLCLENIFKRSEQKHRACGSPCEGVGKRQTEQRGRAGVDVNRSVVERRGQQQA